MSTGQDRPATLELEEVNLLDLAPVRIAPWEDTSEGVVLIRSPPARRGLWTPLEWITYWMAPRRIKLDQVGSFSWKKLDGSSTVGEIATALRSHFGGDAEPAEDRLGRFVRLLRREQLIAFPGYDELAVKGPTDASTAHSSP